MRKSSFRSSQTHQESEVQEMFHSFQKDDLSRRSQFHKKSDDDYRRLSRTCAPHRDSIDTNQRFFSIDDQDGESRLMTPLMEHQSPIKFELPARVQQSKQILRLANLQVRERKVITKEEKWSWDTSAALIRLMVRQRGIRFAMNIYIWVNILLRIIYAALVINYIISEHDFIQNNFYYLIFGAMIGIRFLFMCIIYKLIKIGPETRDVKIRIIYETYVTIFDDTNKQIKALERKLDEFQMENSSIRQVELMHDQEKFRRQIRSLNRWLITLKTWTVIIPPEISFIGHKKESKGFFQVQNFILKSLEMFFFVPPFCYFLWDRLSLEDAFTFKAFQIDKAYTYISWALFIDVVLFVILVIALVNCNQRKRKSIVRNLE